MDTRIPTPDFLERSYNVLINACAAAIAAQWSPESTSVSVVDSCVESPARAAVIALLSTRGWDAVFECITPRDTPGYCRLLLTPKPPLAHGPPAPVPAPIA
jgi:hypothetical protein